MSNDRFSNYGAGKVAGAIEERQRIIKLLLETPEGRDAIELALHPSDEGNSLIALIKGENK